MTVSACLDTLLELTLVLSYMITQQFHVAFYCQDLRFTPGIEVLKHGCHSLYLL